MMDFKTSRKERVSQPRPGTDEWVLVDDRFDLYPVMEGDLILDAEILDDESEELLDRSMFRCVRQRGQDPVKPNEGIEWSEAIMGERSTTTIQAQLTTDVAQEGSGVKIDFANTDGTMSFTLSLASQA